MHHVKGKARGDSMDHLIASCRSCNLRLGDPTKGARNPIHKTVTKW